MCESPVETFVLTGQRGWEKLIRNKVINNYTWPHSIKDRVTPTNDNSSMSQVMQEKYGINNSYQGQEHNKRLTYLEVLLIARVEDLPLKENKV